MPTHEQRRAIKAALGKAPGARAEDAPKKEEEEEPKKPAAEDPPKKDEEQEPKKQAAEGDAPDPDEDDEDDEEKPASPAAIRKQAAAAERTRISQIRALGRVGEEKLIQACIDDPDCSPADAALRLRQAEAGTGKSRLSALREDDAGDHPSVSGDSQENSDNPRAAARASVAAYYGVTRGTPAK